MNRRHPYRDMERDYITSDISLRELCRRYGVSAHSLVVQAKKGRWAEKREQHRAKESESFMSCHAARMADCQAEVNDNALEAIDEAVTNAPEDMRATKLVRQPDGSITEEPVMRLMPKDVALLIDRLGFLFGRPSSVSQHQSWGSARS